MEPIINAVNSAKLLCVENNSTTQVLYRAILEESVASIIFAENGADGYEKFINNEIDFIISDYDMPVLNGLDMIEKIRAVDKDIPIILVSAIDDVNIVVKALELNVTNFLKKPIDTHDIVSIVENALKILFANKILKEKHEKELDLLQKKESYHSYQEELAFAKELNILRNDFYYQMIDDKHVSLVDFLYQPLDAISGDAYTARRIDSYRTFYLIVDGMGKGLSASFTAILMTSFINHMIDRMIEYDSFSLDILVKESLEYIKPILLDEEAVAIEYILFNSKFDVFSYSIFGMPALLMQDNLGKVSKIKSNNPPLSKWQTSYNVDEMSVKNVDKFLFFSDGIVENMTKDSDQMYADFIEEDFAKSFTKTEFKNRAFDKIGEAEDDITLIFINRLPFETARTQERVFETSLDEVDNASSWYNEVISNIKDGSQILNQADLVFTELYMNAYEHGNLGINSKTKHKLLEDDLYIDTLLEKEKECSKKIKVTVNTLIHESSSYIVTQISDEGAGFDTQILSTIFRNSQTFNGRGVFISRKNSMGIYYNVNGNSVLYLNRIEM